MTKQRKHRRKSVKGKEFVAGGGNVSKITLKRYNALPARNKKTVIHYISKGWKLKDAIDAAEPEEEEFIMQDMYGRVCYDDQTKKTQKKEC